MTTPSNLAPGSPEARAKGCLCLSQEVMETKLFVGITGVSRFCDLHVVALRSRMGTVRKIIERPMLELEEYEDREPI